MTDSEERPSDTHSFRHEYADGPFAGTGAWEFVAKWSTTGQPDGTRALSWRIKHHTEGDARWRHKVETGYPVGGVIDWPIVEQRLINKHRNREEARRSGGTNPLDLDADGLPPGFAVKTEHAVEYRRRLSDAEWSAIERSMWLDRAGVVQVKTTEHERSLTSPASRLPARDLLPAGYIVTSVDPPAVHYDRKLAPTEARAVKKWVDAHPGAGVTTR